MTHSSHELPRINKVGMVVLLLSAVVPPMAASGHFFYVDMPVAVALAVVAGAAGAGMTTFGRSSLPAAVIAGPVIALGGLLLTWLWIRQRDAIFNVEVAITAGLGALPGAGLWVLLTKLFTRRRA